MVSLCLKNKGSAVRFCLWPPMFVKIIFIFITVLLFNNSLLNRLFEKNINITKTNLINLQSNFLNIGFPFEDFGAFITSLTIHPNKFDIILATTVTGNLLQIQLP